VTAGSPMMERFTSTTPARRASGYADLSRVDRISAETIVAAPFVGEFGWELMSWQGRLRRVLGASRARHVLLLGAADRRGLYNEMGGAYVELAPQEWPGHASDDGRVDPDGRRIAPQRQLERLWPAIRAVLAQRGLCEAEANEPPASVIVAHPSFCGRIVSTASTSQDFRPLQNGISPLDAAVDVLLIPRGRGLAPQRNLEPKWWCELAARLTARSLRVAMYPHGFEAARAALSECRLAAGGSTGGLHLASLCGCPHFVWGPGDGERWTGQGMTNRRRYETAWNPLGTPVIYESLGWRPSVRGAEEGIASALERIGRGARSGERAAFARTWRRGRRRIDWSAGRAARLLPWRVRHWLAGAEA